MSALLLPVRKQNVNSIVGCHQVIVEADVFTDGDTSMQVIPIDSSVYLPGSPHAVKIGEELQLPPQEWNPSLFSKEAFRALCIIALRENPQES